jgi:hypothetical protein
MPQRERVRLPKLRQRALPGPVQLRVPEPVLAQPFRPRGS